MTSLTSTSTQDPDDGGLRIPTGMPSSGGGGGGGGGGGLDPTPRTTQQVLRENFWLRELIEAQLSALKSRMDAGDKAVQLLQAFADRTPTTMDVQHQVEALREVVMEMFRSINTTFSQNDKALTAALQAQEKQAIATNDTTKIANTKMEDTFTKQIDALSDARRSDAKNMDDKINAIKDRITVIESKTSVSDPTTAIKLAGIEHSLFSLSKTTDFSSGKSAGQMALWALVVGGLGLVFGLVTAVSVILRSIK